MTKMDWANLKMEYVSTRISRKKLAEKYEMQYPQLESRARAEKWTQAREVYKKMVVVKVKREEGNKLFVQQEENVPTVGVVAQKLLNNIEVAITQLAHHDQLVTAKTKIKTITYNDDGKVEEEVTTDQEEKKMERYHCGVKVASLKMLASSLKDVDNILGRSKGEGDDEATAAEILLEMIGGKGDC